MGRDARQSGLGRVGAKWNIGCLVWIINGPWVAFEVGPFIPQIADMRGLRRHVRLVLPDSDSWYLFGGGFGGTTEAAKGSRERPRASRIAQALGLDQPSINTIAQQDRQLKQLD